ncbi:unnamed protein product [Somion occarium]|uniref:Uncharacterized protein n=1 Tax=Somion occarium TaxID=3059160 RepID=A0ABP1CX11_9APHY
MTRTRANTRNTAQATSSHPVTPQRRARLQRATATPITTDQSEGRRRSPRNHQRAGPSQSPADASVAEPRSPRRIVNVPRIKYNHLEHEEELENISPLKKTPRRQQAREPVVVETKQPENYPSMSTQSSQLLNKLMEAGMMTDDIDGEDWKWQRLLRWRSSVSTEGQGAENIHSWPQQRPDPPENEVAMQLDSSSATSYGNQVAENNSFDTNFRVVNHSDLQQVTDEFARQGLKYRVFYPRRKSSSVARNVWLAVGANESIVETVARRIMSGNASVRHA